MDLKTIPHCPKDYKFPQIPTESFQWNQQEFNELIKSFTILESCVVIEGFVKSIAPCFLKNFLATEFFPGNFYNYIYKKLSFLKQSERLLH